MLYFAATRANRTAYMGLLTSYSTTPIGQAMIKALIGTHDDAGMATVRADFRQSRLDHTRVRVDRASRGSAIPDRGALLPTAADTSAHR
jgi:hypothetical protein